MSTIAFAHSESWIAPSLDMPTKGPQAALDSDVEMLIIDNLEGDPISLLACALTCRIWHPYAIVVLYKTISISSYRAFNALRAHMKHINSDYVAKYTRCLDVREGTTGTRRFAQEVLRRLGHLPFHVLRRLALSGVDFGGYRHYPSAPAFGPLTGRFGSVTTLELARCTFSTFRDFLRLIGSVHELRRLRLADLCTVQWPSEFPRSAACQRLRLDEVEMEKLSETFEHELLRWLASDPGGRTCATNLRVLRIRPNTPPEKDSDAAVHASIATVLSALGPSIAELAIPCVHEGAPLLHIPIAPYLTAPAHSAHEPLGLYAPPEPHALPTRELLRGLGARVRASRAHFPHIARCAPAPSHPRARNHRLPDRPMGRKRSEFPLEAPQRADHCGGFCGPRSGLHRLRVACL